MDTWGLYGTNIYGGGLDGLGGPDTGGEDLGMDTTAAFLSSKNIIELQSHLYSRLLANDGKLTRSKFDAFIAQSAKDFAKTRNLSAYTTAQSAAVGFVDTTEVLPVINADFREVIRRYFKWPSAAPGSLAWKPRVVQVMDRNYRDSNNIPVQRMALHTRHYDRSNEGLADSMERASLEGFTRGYDMSSIYAGTSSAATKEWASM